MQVSKINIAGAVAPGEAHLMAQSGTIWLVPEVHQEVWVQCQPAFLGVHVKLDDLRTPTGHIRVELLVPR